MTLITIDINDIDDIWTFNIQHLKFDIIYLIFDSRHLTLTRQYNPVLTSLMDSAVILQSEKLGQDSPVMYPGFSGFGTVNVV